MSVGMLVVPVQGAEGGLTWGEVLQSIPSDPASVFTMFLVVLVVGLIFWYGVRGGGAKGGGKGRTAVG